MTDWYVKAREFANCNCSYGCPCQFNALPTHGFCAALVGLEIEDVPVELHVVWEAMLKGAQYMQVLGQEIDRWMGPYRLQWERERQAAADA